MYQKGEITFVDEKNKRIFINFSTQSCSKGCEGCSAGEGGCEIKIYGPVSYSDDFNVKIMDQVEIEIYPKIHLIPVAFLFFFPIISIFFIYFSYVDYHIGKIGIFLFSFFILFLYILIAKLLNKKWKNIEKGKLLRIL